MWAAASELAVDDIPIATEAERVAKQTLKQQVLCVEQDGDIPDNWAGRERYPAQVLPVEAKAGRIPTTCKVTTSTASPPGEIPVVLQGVVPEQQVRNELSTQARAMVDAFSPQSYVNRQAAADMLINAFAPLPHGAN